MQICISFNKPQCFADRKGELLLHFVCINGWDSPEANGLSHSLLLLVLPMPTPSWTVLLFPSRDTMFTTMQFEVWKGVVLWTGLQVIFAFSTARKS